MRGYRPLVIIPIAKNGLTKSDGRHSQIDWIPYFTRPPDLTVRQRQLYGLERYPVGDNVILCKPLITSTRDGTTAPGKDVIAPTIVLFAGNSMTYQPKELKGISSKELMGLPAVVEKVARGALSMEVICDSVTQGGASLLQLWEDFQAYVHSSKTIDVVVLQVGCGVTEEAQVLRDQYGPLIHKHNPRCRVVLYDLWLFPGRDLPPGEDELAIRTMDSYREALLFAGLTNICIANVGAAWRELREDVSCDRRIYPALFKDDMQHPSALGGLLNGSVVALSLAQAAPRRPLHEVLEAILPPFWRTGSIEFHRSLGTEPDFGMKLWKDFKQNLSAGLVDDDDDEELLGKYPPGTRTEKRDLGICPCEAVARAALSNYSAADNERLASIAQSGPAPAMLAVASAAPSTAASSERKSRWGRR